MTSSRNKIYPFLGLLTAGTLLVSGSVFAQEKPRSLFPVQKPAASAKPDEPLIPSSSTIQTDGEKQSIERGAGKGTLVIQSLGGLDAASIGTLGVANGGFGAGMWRGTAPERVVTLLKFLPTASHSPQAQDLARRLLLTAAAIPQGLENPTKLVQLRLDKLQAAGRVPDASALLAQLPPAVLNAELAKTRANLQLLQDQNAEACKQVPAEKRRSNDNFWTKLEVFCHVVDGNFERAELGATLLEEGQEDDGAFFTLFDRLAGGKSELAAGETLITPLHFAMMRQGGLAVPYELASKAGYDILWALATDKTAEKNARLLAAFASLDAGSIGPTLSRQLITEEAFEEAVESGIGQIAALYRALAAEKDPERKIGILQNLWAAGTANGTYFPAAKLSLPALEMIPATPQDEGFDLDALRLFLAEGDITNAQNWERQARRGALRGTNEEREAARKRITRVDAYMLVSGAPGIARWNAANFDLMAFADNSNLDKGANAGFLLTVLEEFGETVPDSLWSQALNLGQVPRSSFSNLVIEKNMTLASEAGRMGETVALALTVLGTDGPSAVATSTLATVLSSLKRVGLEEEARLLALEAAVLRDL